MSKILVTGCAGFIGFHVASALLLRDADVVGVDSLNEYYSLELKHDRLKQLQDQRRFQFVHLDLADRTATAALFASERFDKVIHLAAQAGVRYSLTAPQAYIDANLVGFGNVLEGCRHSKVAHLVYASSSSVYGLNRNMPFSEHSAADHPVSLYAATKRANEMMAHSYAHLFGLPCTGLRFFTVYGPWGRPDMAAFLFTRAILEGKPIDVFNQGQLRRDFTYIDDIVEGVLRIAERIPAPDPAWTKEADPASSSAPFRVYNIGNHQPVEVLQFIRILEEKIGRKAQLRMLPMQPGDVLATYADTNDLARDTSFRPGVSLDEGLGKFVKWFREYYKL